MVNPVHRVHVSVDRPGVLGPPWTDAGADRGHGGALTKAWPSAAPVRQSSPVGAQNGEGARGTRLGSHRSSSGAVEAGRRWCRTGRRRHSVRGRLERGEKRREAGRGAVNSGGGLAFYMGAGGTPGRGGRELIAGINGFNAIEGVKAR
jgi:hypothetical protein